MSRWLFTSSRNNEALFLKLALENLLPPSNRKGKIFFDKYSTNSFEESIKISLRKIIQPNVQFYLSSIQNLSTHCYELDMHKFLWLTGGMRGSKNLMVAEISKILSIHGLCIQSSKNLMVIEISYNRTNNHTIFH